jgi:hypothetical protein
MHAELEQMADECRVLAAVTTASGKHPGGLCPVARVRQIAGMTKAAFDAAALRLRAQRRVELHHTDAGWVDREPLIVDRGVAYVGIALRDR